MIDELWPLVVVVAISALAAAAQFATGTGYGVVAAPLLLFVAPRALPVPLLVSTVVVMALIVLRLRASLAPRDLLPAALGALPGLVLGTVLLGVIPPPVDQLAVGLIVLLGVAASVFGLALPRRTSTLAGAGLVSGVFTVVAAMPGPPIALAYRPEDPDRLRATLSAFFCAVSAGSLVAVLPTQHVDHELAGLTGALIVGALGGTALAAPFLRLLTARSIRVGTLALCTLAGASLVVRSLGGLAG